MNMSARHIAPQNETPPFLSAGLEPLQKAIVELRPILSALEKLEDLAQQNAAKKLRALKRQLREVEPSLTLIGQIKSGKTTLINAMIGQHALLPADVNPWTSVVTTLRLTPDDMDPPTNARFDFFEDGEWARLIRSGGRIGELAERAGADEQLAQVKAQIEAMRRKSQSRLGRKFEMLLGQSHHYPYFDQALIERYVCLGDDFDDAPDRRNQTGRFADITKSAILRMQAPYLPVALSIRDTPGINDTFMMREQVTLQSIRESRVCVVVLSAHQALSTDDLALIRLISNSKSRDVILFVNRIDELPNPLRQIEQIKDSIRDTLLKHKAPVGVEIIFGSAHWASAAVQNDIGFLSEDSKASLLNWAESFENRPPAHFEPIEMLWHLSGVPKLNAAIAHRMAETIVAENTSDVAKKAMNIASQVRATDGYAVKCQAGKSDLQFDGQALIRQIRAIADDCNNSLDQALTKNRINFEERLERAADGFLGRATEALLKHLERNGDGTPWQYDPTGLRVLLGSAYRAFERGYLSEHKVICAEAITQIQHLIANALKMPLEALTINNPMPNRVPPPIAIGQTIALDLSGSWWQSWWSRWRGYESYADNFRALIAKEIDPLLNTLKSDVRQDICEANLITTSAFFDDLIQSWTEVASRSELSSAELSNLLDLPTLKKRSQILDQIDVMLKTGLPKNEN